jgi:hypothetical protein
VRCTGGETRGQTGSLTDSFPLANQTQGLKITSFKVLLLDFTLWHAYPES